MTDKIKSEVTVLGAGIMGLMAAHTLANHHKIKIHDPNGFAPDQIKQNASIIAGGMLAPYAEIEHMNMQWIKAGLHGIDLWENIKLDTGFKRHGSLLIAHTEDQHILERFKSHLPAHKQTYQNVQTLEPQSAQHHKTGIFLDEEAHLDPLKTMTALCAHLKKHPNVELSTKPVTHNPQFTINCTGMAANDPQLRGVKGETLIVRNTEFTLNRPVRLMHPRYPLYIIPRENNIFMIGATVIESSENETTSLRSSMELMSALYALHPSFAEAEIIEIKAGIRPSYPDNLPRITVNDNEISCNGLFRHGYLLAPVMAECVHDHLNGKRNKYMSLFEKGKNNAKQTKSDNKRAA